MPSEEQWDLVSELANLVDRDNEWRKLKKHLTTRTTGPLIVVLPGEENDLHRAFVRRCARYEIPRLLRVQSFLAPGTQLPWPSICEDLDQIYESIAQSLGIDPYNNPDEVWQHVKNSKIQMCFGISINHKLWNGGNNKHVGAFMRSISEYSRKVVPDSLVVVFLSIKLDGASSTPNMEEIQNCWASCGAGHQAFPQLDIISLDRMPQIEQSDIDNWVFACEIAINRLKIDVSADMLTWVQTKMAEKFADAQKSIPMTTAWSHIDALLREYYYRPVFERRK